MPDEVAIRPEEPGDHPAVFDVNARAFGSPAEAKLVDELREAASPAISLVAVASGRVVGHVFFSPVDIEGSGKPLRLIALGPLAVLPEHQNRGIGSLLSRAGLEACRDLGCDAVFVLGHRGYYPRFGFSVAKERGLYYDPRELEGAFMVAELRPGALDGCSGRVVYHPAFYRLEGDG